MVQRILVDVCAQMIYLVERDASRAPWPVSTAANGPGEQSGSGQTPRGLHEIRAKIGAGAPPGAVFIGRRATGEVCSAEFMREYPDRDWITSRILWLRGLEPGRNRGGDVDSMRRYIYIHGTPHVGEIGTAVSHGCVRMRDEDVIELFELVEVGTVVEIVA